MEMSVVNPVRSHAGRHAWPSTDRQLLLTSMIVHRAACGVPHGMHVLLGMLSARSRPDRLQRIQGRKHEALHSTHGTRRALAPFLYPV